MSDGPTGGLNNKPPKYHLIDKIHAYAPEDAYRIVDYSRFHVRRAASDASGMPLFSYDLGVDQNGEIIQGLGLFQNLEGVLIDVLPRGANGMNLSIKYNPTNIGLGGNDAEAETIGRHDFIRSIEAANSIIERAGIVVSVEDMRLSRLDICTTVRVPASFERIRYLIEGMAPKHYLRYSYPTSMLLSRKSWNIKIYDKRQEQDSIADSDSCLLRIEVGINRHQNIRNRTTFTTIGDMVEGYDTISDIYSLLLQKKLFKMPASDVLYSPSTDIYSQTQHYLNHHGLHGARRLSEALRIKMVYDRDGYKGIERIISLESEDNPAKRWRLRKKYRDLLSEIIFTISTDGSTMSLNDLYALLKEEFLCK